MSVISEICNPANIYLLQVNNRNTWRRCEICSKWVKTPEQCHWRRSGVFYCVSIVDFNHVYVSCKWNLQQTCKPAIIIRQLERQLFLILATNNHASFYLRRKKKMMKYEKVQKYYDHHGISFSNKNHFLLYPLDRKILISKFIYTFLEHYLAFLLF